MAERKRPQRGKKREKKNVPVGHAHIQSTFNNTIVTITDTTGNVVSWGTRGWSDHGLRKSTPYARGKTGGRAARDGEGSASRSSEAPAAAAAGDRSSDGGLG